MSFTSALADDGVLIVTLDDGAKNALRTETFDELIAVLDDTPEGTKAIVLTGQSGMFSPGLDLKSLMSSDFDGITATIRSFGTASMRLWADPRPTVCAADGHAIAGGTVLAMACDHTVAAAGSWAWGLNETSIDMELPDFIVEIARANVRADRLQDLLLPGTRLDPEAAVEAGFADELAPQGEVLARAQFVAAERGALPERAYRKNKARFRQTIADRVMAGLDDDIAEAIGHFKALLG